MAKNGDGTEGEDAPVVPAPPPLPIPAADGTVRVRIRPGFPTHIFIIPAFDLEIDQSWQEIPESQVSEVTQIAAENQVPLEVDE